MFCESCFGLFFFQPIFSDCLKENLPYLGALWQWIIAEASSHIRMKIFLVLLFLNIVIEISSMQCFSIPVPGGCISNCNLKLNGKSTSQGPCSHARHCANINPLKVTCERRCLANNNLRLPLIKMRRSYSEQAARYLECNDPDRVMSRVNTLTAINTPAWDFFCGFNSGICCTCCAVKPASHSSSYIIERVKWSERCHHGAEQRSQINNAKHGKVPKKLCLFPRLG